MFSSLSTEFSEYSR